MSSTDKTSTTRAAFGRAALQSLAAGLIFATSAQDAALAGPKNNSTEPAHTARPASGGGGGARPQGGFGGGGRMPGAMSGGAHIPGSMGGGGYAHVPGSMGGGGYAHVPGSMGGGGNAHVPGSMGGGAHVPGAMANGAHMARPREDVARAPSERHQAGAAHGGASPAQGRQAHAGDVRQPGHGPGPSAHADNRQDAHADHRTEAHGGGRQAGPSGFAPHGGGTRPAGSGAAFAARNHDARVGGHFALHTAGLPAAPRAHVDRAFLRADPHRDPARDREFVGRHRGDFHTRLVRDFNARELGVWRGGLWRNEWHYGRRGWWWDVGGVWYGYPEPIFPYPIEVAALTVYDAPFIDGPDLSAEEYSGPQAGGDYAASGYGGPGAPSDPGAIPPLPAAPAGWFRCGDPGGFYPGVGACSSPWLLVDNAPQPDAP